VGWKLLFNYLFEFFWDGETDKGVDPEEKKKIKIIPLLAASEKGKGQTESSLEKEIEMW